MKTLSNFVHSEKTLFEQSVQAFLPKFTYVPVSELKNNNYICSVKKGDIVTEGQVVATELDEVNHEFSVNIHASVPGVVEDIINCPLPNGNIGRALKIKMGGSFSYLGKKIAREEGVTYTNGSLAVLCNEMGILNTFKKPVPLAKQIISFAAKSERFIVVRLFDEDPSRLTDTFISNKYISEVVEGVAVIAKAVKADGVVFALPLKMDENFDTQVLGSIPTLKIVVNTNRYPCGLRENLVQLIRKNSKETKSSYFSSVSPSSFFIDSSTAYSVYEAAVLKKPVVERFVYVTGDCLESAAMFKVRIGTKIECLAEQCGGFKINPAKIVVNGVLCGNAVSTMDSPITSTVKSIHFLPSKKISDQHVSSCVRCGLCRRICPEGLFPDLLYKIKSQDENKSLAKTSLLCSDCMLCNSSCPSRLPLSQKISILKGKVNE